ncbi:hypothetical protein ALC53_05532 [Atta colombica]|uniref:Uncharacterized protein n=1 Tax=Atta colombica TaxID=520822 RepID=A0A195BIP0_9HYME|nr:hypothetical protein ALC53_05532 [Atta colombica]
MNNYLSLHHRRSSTRPLASLLLETLSSLEPRVSIGFALFPLMRQPTMTDSCVFVFYHARSRGNSSRRRASGFFSVTYMYMFFSGFLCRPCLSKIRCTDPIGDSRSPRASSEVPGVLEAAPVVVAFVILLTNGNPSGKLIQDILILQSMLSINMKVIDNMRPPPMSRSRRNGGGGGGGYGSRPNIRSLYPFLSGPPPIPPLGHSFDQ